MSHTLSRESSSQTFDRTEPFVESTIHVFSKMLKWDVRLIEARTTNSFQRNHDITGIIGFSGEIRGAMVIGMSQEFAFAAAEAFYGGTPTSIDADVMDMVGELANLVGGNAKERMSYSGIHLGLPTVICGQEQRVSFVRSSQVELLLFDSPFGKLVVETAISVS